MTSSGPSKWEPMRAERLTRPEARDRYDRMRRSVEETRRILQVIDSERERVGLTKAELARRIGVYPSAMRRLLASNVSNPMLRILVAIFDALNLEFSLEPTTRASGADEPLRPAALMRVPPPRESKMTRLSEYLDEPGDDR